MDGRKPPLLNESVRGATLTTLGLLAALSGLWALFSESWTLPYRLNLVFHPLIGLIGVVAAVLWTGKSAFPGRVQPRMGRRNLLIAALMIALILPGVFKAARGIPALVIGAVIVNTLARSARRPTNATFLVKALAFLATRFFVLTAYSGVEIFVMGMGRPAMPAFWLHRVSSLLFMGAAILLALARLNLTVRIPPIKKLVRYVRAPSMLVLCFAAAVALDARTENPVYDFHLSTIPTEEREPFERLRTFEIARPELMDQTQSCGTSGCHPSLLEDHAKSNHDRSMRTAYIQKNMDAMVEEIGLSNKNLCAGCHFPQALFEPEQTYKDFAGTRHNYSCVFCHAAHEVEWGKDPKRSILELSPNLRHLAVIAPEDDGGLSALTRFQVALYPDGHGRALLPPVLATDNFCQVCHHLEIETTKESGFPRSLCMDCHMQPREDLQLAGREKNHLFVGANNDVAHAIGDESHSALVRRFVEAEYPIDLEAWGQVSEFNSDTMIRRWLEMQYEPRTAPIPGKPFHFLVWTANSGIDHPFPAGSLDLAETWMRIQLTDADGRVLLSEGELGPGFAAPVTPHRLGGYVLDKDGGKLQRYRVWRIAKKVVERYLAFGQRTSDRFETVLPEDVKGPLTLSATWNYRKLSQEYIDWAMGPEHTMPIVQVGRLHQQINLADPSEVLATIPETAPDVVSNPHEVVGAHP